MMRSTDKRMVAIKNRVCYSVFQEEEQVIIWEGPHRESPKSLRGRESRRTMWIKLFLGSLMF